MKQVNDSNVIDLLTTDEKAAVANIYLEHGQQVKKVALRLLGNKDDADDVVQEVFIDFLEKQSWKRIETTVRKYLLGAVWNKSKDLLRKRIREQEKLREYVIVNRIRKKTYKNRLERMLWLEKELDKIPAGREKEILEAVIDRYESYAQIAVRFGCTVGHVKKIRLKYYQKLKITE